MTVSSSRCTVSPDRRTRYGDGVAVAIVLLAFLVKRLQWNAELIFPLLYVAFRLYEDHHDGRSSLRRVIFHVAIAAVLGVALHYVF